jgi:alanyl-tRNA synthetase
LGVLLKNSPKYRKNLLASNIPYSMTSSEIRRTFIEFFKSKEHLIVPSAPLVLKNDPSLLFTNSGMVQFKDYFLGNSKPKANRIADTQKCLRVSGKHNDLEDVGFDTYHHTMFEMLGNWSFGDYFKKEAIEWAWELLTEQYKLPQERLYVSVFGGDKGDNLPVDEEAIALWTPIVGADRIIHGKKKDNFWEMGEAGPCGPCSEIHIDLRSEAEVKLKSGKDLVNADHPQVVEIWNLVFIQFNRLASGALEPLPSKHVDTGMGFERLCMAIQKKTSNYDTDVFTPLIVFISREAGIQYGSDKKKDIAVRVMADHIRAVSFAIADGQLPSNTGAGYVIRRILRRAVRYGFSYLDFKEPFLYKLTPILAEQLRDVFPELSKQLDYISRVIHEEEISFLRTLDKGLKLIDTLVNSVKDADKVIPGAEAFTLYDTYGFPFDLSLLIARERGFTIDEAAFKIEMAKQKSRSKADASKETGDWILVKDGSTEFIGYDQLSSESQMLRYRKIKQKNKDLYQLVFDKTPFYAESGGQVGDTGTFKSINEKIDIIDTKKENDLIVHISENLPEKLDSVWSGQVNANKRLMTMNNHSATHLLHAALRAVLGKHVEQKGSLVNEKILRFDFSHFAAMTDEEIAKVESIVNQKVRENIELNEQRNVPIEKAKSMGAMALFGEKYGDFVRVITFDPTYSVELCGGTHISHTGKIGLFKVISESSVAAGVRRIEAVTAEGAQQFVNEELARLQEVKTILKNPKDIVAAAKSLAEEKHVLEKKLEQVYKEQANLMAKELIGKIKEVKGVSFLAEKISLPDADSLKDIAYAIKNKFGNLFLVLAADIQGKPQVAVMLGDQIVADKKFHAGEIIKQLAKEIDGGGGGQPFFATAGGKKLEGLDAVVSKAKEFIKG